MALDLYPKTVTRNRQMFKKSQGGEKVVKNLDYFEWRW